MIFDPHQILTKERIVTVSGVCTLQDELLIAIALAGEPGSLNYIEYPYLPVRSLVRRGERVDLVFWKITATDVKFGFRLTGCTEKFLSESTAVHVVPKFAKALDRLTNTYPVKILSDGSKDITVQGGVGAMFFKNGRSFDVELTYMAEPSFPCRHIK